MTKAERSELRSLIRQQFKVLRGDLGVREAELLVGVEQDVVARFADRDVAWEEVLHVAGEASRACDRAINDALYAKGFIKREGSEQVFTSVRLSERPPDLGRAQLRAEAQIGITAKVKAARHELDRREADLLRRLTLDALESDAARGFLDAIPSVGDLVPVTRLAELEASLTDEDQP